jgi:hypothetical protein
MLSILNNARRVPLPLPQNRTNGTNGRTARLCIFTEVCEDHVRDHELEAARGWDALILLCDAVALALTHATPPAAGMPFTCARTAQAGSGGGATAFAPPRPHEARRQPLARIGEAVARNDRTAMPACPRDPRRPAREPVTRTADH